jgi:hypothetical protein
MTEPSPTSIDIYGCDFSGARDPSRGLWYAAGRLSASGLELVELQRCDDRLDLAAAIMATCSPWGLDFPFAWPVAAYAKMGYSGWLELLEQVTQLGRDDFDKRLSRRRIPKAEGTCQERGTTCRLGDVNVSAKSPFKVHNPNMRAMTYGGLKLLAHTRSFGARVYPFDAYDRQRPRLYEVYPGHTWRAMRIARCTELPRALSAWSQLSSLEVSCPERWKTLAEQDAADAVIACITLGAWIAAHGGEPEWDSPPQGVTPDEWESRRREGLIARPCFDRTGELHKRSL